MSLPSLVTTSGIDLEQAHVLFDERLVQGCQQRAQLLLQIAVEAERLGDAAHVMRADVGHRIDRDGDDLVRRVVRDLLDVHAAFGRDHDRDARGRAIDQHRQVELPLDGGAFLDVEPVHLLAARAGLVRDQRRAEQPRRLLSHVVDGLDHLDAAGLAAAAGVDLRLHHPDRAAELLRGLHRLVDAERRDAPRHRHAETSQHRLGLVLVDVHGVGSLAPRTRRVAGPRASLTSGVPDRSARQSMRAQRSGTGSIQLFPRSGAIFWQASTSDFTAAADFSNSLRSALVSSSSTMRSTPFAPMTTGTPT